MKSGYSHIIQAHHLIAVGFGCQCRFLCYRNIRGSRSCYHDFSQPIRCRKLTDGANPCVFPIVHLWICFSDFSCLFLRQPGEQDRLYLMLQHCANDPHHLLRCLSGSVNDLSRSLTDSTMQIHLRVTDILKGLFLNREQCVIHAKLAVLHCFQCFSDLAVHPRTSRSRSTAG